MLTLIRDLVDLANRRESPTWQRDRFFREAKRYYTMELTDPDPNLVHHEATIQLPASLEIRSGIKAKPTQLADNLNHVLRPDFWDQLIEDAKTVGDPDVVSAVRAARDNVLSWVTGPCAPCDSNSTYIYVLPRGTRKLPAPSVVAVKRKDVPSTAFSEQQQVVPTLRGVPLAQMPSFQAWCANRKLPSTGEDLDVITGQLCEPLRLHPHIKALQAPLMSFKNLAFCTTVVGADGKLWKPWTRDSAPGLNFPMSKDTSDKYSSALNRLMEDARADILPEFDLFAVVWPGSGTDHPIVPMAVRLIGGNREPLGELWDELEALDADETVIHIAFFQASKGRVALLEHLRIPASDLRNALLRFRMEFVHLPERSSVRDMVTFSTKPKKPAALPKTLFLPLIKAVLTGGRFPSQLSYSLDLSHLDDESGSIAAAWITADYNRNTGVSPMTTLCFDPDVEPNLRLYLRGPQDNPYYIHGILCGLHYGLRRVHHAGLDAGKKGAHAQAIRHMAMTSPETWAVSSEASKRLAYVSKLSKNGFSKYLVFDAHWAQFNVEMGVAPRGYPSIPQQNNIVAGFDHTALYVDHMIDYIRSHPGVRLASV